MVAVTCTQNALANINVGRRHKEVDRSGKTCYTTHLNTKGADMNKDGAMVCFTVGFFLTFGGVGTVEQSVDNAGLITGILVAVVGLLIMGCGSLAIRVLESK